MDIMTILIIVCSIVAIIAITYSVKANRQIENIWEDRGEFYSSACDESLIKVKGFKANPKTREVVYWNVQYKNAYFTVYADNLNMYKYLTEEQITALDNYKNSDDTIQSVMFITI